MALAIMPLTMNTLSLMSLTINTLNKMTLTTIDINMTPSKGDSQHNDSQYKH